MRLRCISRYRNAKLSVEAGAVLDLTEAEARQLQADAPGCWEDADLPALTTEGEVDDTTIKALKAPPHDKMVKGAKTK